jgi:hypothetical protein
MKHWDLFPNETVTLSHGAMKLTARFLFRDTTRACFELFDDDLTFREFHLRRDGDLSVGFGEAEVMRKTNAGDYNSAEAVRAITKRRHVRRIEGPDRYTRHVILREDPVSRSAAGGIS